MASRFVVSTKSETPKLYVAQIELPQILNELRGWTDRFSHNAYVFAARRVGSFGSQLINAPLDHAELSLEAIVKPHDRVDSLMHMWGLDLDDVPYEQAMEKIQSMLDFVDRKRLSITSRNQREQQVDEAGEERK